MQNGQYTEALPLFRAEHARKIPGTQGMLAALKVGSCLGHLGQFEEAHTLAASVVTRAERELGQDHYISLMATEMVATCLSYSGRLNHNGLPLLQRVIAVRERMLGPDHPTTMTATASLINCLRNLDRVEEAMTASRALATRGVRVLGREDHSALRYVNLFACCLQHGGQFQKALVMHNVALEGRRRVLGHEHPDTLQTEQDGATCLVMMKRYAEANPVLERILECQRRVLGMEHPHTLRTTNELGMGLSLAGRARDGLPLLRIASEVATRTLGATNLYTLQYLQNTAACLYASRGGEGCEDHSREAGDILRRAAAASRRALGSEHAVTKSINRDLADFMERCAETIQLRPMDRTRMAMSAWRSAQTAARRVPHGPSNPAWVDEWANTSGTSSGTGSSSSSRRGGGGGGGRHRSLQTTASPRGRGDAAASSSGLSTASPALPPLPAGLVEQPWADTVIANNLGSGDCAICLDELGESQEGGVMVVQLDCRHTFCTVCIRFWLTTQHGLTTATEAAATCPECRAEIRGM